MKNLKREIEDIIKKINSVHASKINPGHEVSSIKPMEVKSADIMNIKGMSALVMISHSGQA